MGLNGIVRWRENGFIHAIGSKPLLQLVDHNKHVELFEELGQQFGDGRLLASDISSKTVRLSWADVDSLTRRLAEAIIADQYDLEVIIGILRGGCIPAIHLSHILSIRHFIALHVQTRATDQARSERIEPIILKPRLLEEIRGKRILLVDEVTNTGMTLRAASEFVQSFNPASVRSAVLVWDTQPPKGMINVSGIVADYCIEKIDAWVRFPWTE
jgi:hypoxanthine phosphoribosyltransferase